MIKSISVMNKSSAQKFYHHPQDERSIAISITNVGEGLANIYPSPDNRLFDVCRVQFDDVSRGEPNCMTENDARKIADFLSKYKDKNIDKLIVHCEAGQSRSAGVAAAAMKYLHGDDSPIFNSPKFTPNMTCYNLTLNALMEKEQSLEDILSGAASIAEKAQPDTPEIDSFSAAFLFDNPFDDIR